MKRYDGYLLLIPGFLAGINASAGASTGILIFGTLALSAAIAVLLDRVNPMKIDEPSVGGAAFVGLAIGLTGMSLGYLLASSVDYIRSY